MPAALSSKTTTEAIQRVNQTLHGPVSVILSSAVSELSGVPKKQIYDHVLDNLPVLEKSLKILKNDRRRFEDVIVNDKGKFVEDNAIPLSCGRSLDQVVAMVVRSATRRHFRQVATGSSPLPHLTTPGEADELYGAIREHLLFDWQVVMVPTYAEMTPPIARDIGDQISVIHELSKLKELIAEKRSPQNGGSKSTIIPSSINIRADDIFSFFQALESNHLRTDPFEDFMKDPELIGIMEAADMKEILLATGGAGAHFIVYGMGINPKQLMMILHTAYTTMGKNVYSRIFGLPGDRELIVKLTQYGIFKKINGSSALNDCAFFIKNFVSQAVIQTST